MSSPIPSPTESINLQVFRTPPLPSLAEENSEYTISRVALESLSSSTRKRPNDGDSTLSPSPKAQRTCCLTPPHTSPEKHTGLSPWIKKNLTLSPDSAFRRVLVLPSNPRPAAACSLQEEDPSDIKLLNELYQCLKAGISTDDFEKLEKIFTTLDNRLWTAKKTNTEENSSNLFSSEVIILLEEIYFKLHTLKCEEMSPLLKKIKICLNYLNKFQTEKQTLSKLKKFHKLSEEVPKFQDLFKRTFNKNFVIVDSEDEPIQNIFDDHYVLNHTIRRCNEDLQTCNEEERGLLRQLQAFLQKELEKQPIAPAIREYHFTSHLEKVVDILNDGIQVDFTSKHVGAFVSSDPEESFGEYGITVSIHKLGCFSSPDLSRKERRPDEEGSSIWSGYCKPIRSVQLDRILVTQRVTEEKLSKLRELLNQRGYSNTIIIPVEVEKKLIQYQRELGRITPISPRVRRNFPLHRFSEGKERY